MSSYIAESCPCGRTSNRLVAIVGRTGDAIKVRGMFVVFKQAEQVVRSFEPVSRFQIAVGRSGQRDEMTLKIELEDETIDRETLAEDLNRRFQNLCRVKIDKIEFVETGAIPEEHQTIVDERTWE
jgi:phenylacetate-CoA ligase